MSSYVTVLLACALCSTASAQPITVRILDGKKGKPRSKVRIYIVLGDPKQQHFLNLRTDEGGAVRFASGEAKTFQVRPIGEVACGEHLVGAPESDYSVNTVMTRGAVTRNDCGLISPQQYPGPIDLLHPVRNLVATLSQLASATRK